MDEHRILAEVGKSAQPILPKSFMLLPWLKLDLSAANKELPTSDLRKNKLIESYIFNLINASGCSAGYGGYDEERAWYQTSQHFQATSENEPRTVHLGVDIWVDAGTSVCAPIDGKIHSFKDNNNYLDYGPTIILEHNSFGLTWYSLYGHLSRESLKTLNVGSRVLAGDSIALTGQFEENGNWVPHLHFQLILDLQNWSGDFPGVASRKDRQHYLNICPDPALILNPSLI